MRKGYALNRAFKEQYRKKLFLYSVTNNATLLNNGGFRLKAISCRGLVVSTNALN